MTPSLGHWAHLGSTEQEEEIAGAKQTFVFG